MVAKEHSLLLWACCKAAPIKNICCISFSVGYIRLNKIESALDKSFKCVVTMQGMSCLQHVMGNTSQLNQVKNALVFVFKGAITSCSLFPENTL